MRSTRRRTFGEIGNAITTLHEFAQRRQDVLNAHRINQGQMPLRSEDGDTSCDFYFISAKTPEEIGEKLFHVVTERIPNPILFGGGNVTHW